MIPENEWRWRPAVFVAALWALHPVLTDAVTYISGRRDILGGLCVFCGLWAYLRFRAARVRRVAKYGWLLLSCVAYGLGILSKESAIVLPLLCWLYDVQHEGVVASLRRRWAVYFFVLFLGGAVLWHFSGAIILATLAKIRVVRRKSRREFCHGRADLGPRSESDGVSSYTSCRLLVQCFSGFVFICPSRRAARRRYPS